MVHDFFQRISTVVVEVRRSVAQAAHARDVELVPIVEWRRAADETRQQGAAWIRARATRRRAIWQRDFISTCIASKAWWARRKHEARRRHDVHPSRTLREDL